MLIPLTRTIISHQSNQSNHHTQHNPEVGAAFSFCLFCFFEFLPPWTWGWLSERSRHVLRSHYQQIDDSARQSKQRPRQINQISAEVPWEAAEESSGNGNFTASQRWSARPASARPTDHVKGPCGCRKVASFYGLSPAAGWISMMLYFCCFRKTNLKS